MNDRSVCILICCFKKLRCRNVNITIKTFVAERGLGLKMTTWRTFSRRLNENGYGFFHARNKGLLSERDRKKRRTYARNMKCCLLQKKYISDSFYLDGLSFIYKHNPFSSASSPKSQIWRKRGESLQFTAKDSQNMMK